jgi:glucose/arabinose dehydrogenase
MTSTLTSIVMLVFALALNAANLPKCDPDNGGLTLPPGFCALVVADHVGTARHLVVAPNGDVYVAIRGNNPGGVIALRDTNGDGRAETKEHFSEGSSTGVALHHGYLYVAHPTRIERFKMTPGELLPSGAAETIVTGLPTEREHEDKGITFDDKGSLYINVGAPSNACQSSDRKPRVKGMDPCPVLEKHGGIWKFDENKLNQTQEEGTRFATGLRQMPGIAWHDGAVYLVMNNRDQLDIFWPGVFTAKENAERPAEAMFRAVAGSNFGWPYCFFDYGEQKFLLNPEYGGDGKTVGRCDQFTRPVASFPAHWAPLDLMFYSGKQFPAKYRGGAFIAFHGSWNRAPMPMDGYNVTFQPFEGSKPSGKFEIFANGFAGRTPLMSPNDAMWRADGVAQGPDGSLYISDSQKGRIWRVIYQGK